MLRVRPRPASRTGSPSATAPWRTPAPPLTAGPGCTTLVDFGPVNCAPASRVEADGGDGPDSIRIESSIPADLHGGSGDDELHGGPFNDVLAGDSGSDFADGEDGDDRILLRDRKLDTALCGGGRDRVRAEVLDSLDYACETVDLGPPGRVGRLRPSRSPKRFVKIPGPERRADRPPHPGQRRLPDPPLQDPHRGRLRAARPQPPRRASAGPGHRHRARAPAARGGRSTAWPSGPSRARTARGMPFRWVGYNGDRQPRPRRPPPPLLAAPRRALRPPVRTVWRGS